LIYLPHGAARATSACPFRRQECCREAHFAAGIRLRDENGNSVNYL
jgi:hypothetical protein